MSKKYADYTAEEKAAYKMKRDAYWKERSDKTAAAFDRLEAELKGNEKLLGMLNELKGLAGIGKTKGARSDGYLTKLFGTETPEVGQVSSYLYIGVRGPNGERLNDGETMAQFITRVGDAEIEVDAKSINGIIWYVTRRGYKIKNDTTAKTVTLLGLPE
jgi:hypothetical protein